jgi:PAS domain S-box-containing protein
MASSEFAVASGSRDAGFFDLLRSFTDQARLALGIRGVLWATAAGAVGLACCLVAFADIGMSLHRSDVDPQRRRARDVVALDNTSRLLMRDLLARSGASRPVDAERQSSGSEPWQAFIAALGTLCQDFNVPQQTMLASTCKTQSAFETRVAAEVAAVARERRPLDPGTLRELLSLRDDISELSLATTRATDAAIGRLVDDYFNALVVLTLCTTGFACAGLILILLVGRTSMDYHAQWRRAMLAAGDAGAARDLLSEVIEALPAGIVVYDADERLKLFNSMARELTPALAESDAIGKTYEELARATGVRREAMGLGPQPVETWIERFRSRIPQRTRESDNGRWYDWSEKGTASGLTVGLRVDVTDLKEHELALEQARTEYQSLVDSLADVAYRLDVESGKFTFVSAASIDLFGVPPEKMVGSHFLDYIGEESLERVRNTTTRPYRADDPGTFARFVMLGAGGKGRHVEVRARRRLDSQGRIESTGLIRDVEERVQLEARLAQEMTRLRSVVGSGGALIVLVDRELNVTMVNSGFTALTGIAEADAVGRPLHTLIDVPIDPARTKRSRLTIKLADRRTADGSGRERLIAVTATPVVDSAGQVSSIVLLGVDDTERREAEQALYNAERFATVGEMAGTMAHEISQPLQVINLSCMLAREELAAGGDGTLAFVDGKLERISQQVDQASRIVGDLRAYVRGTATEAPTPFDANEAVRRAIDLTDHGVREAGMAFVERLAEPLPSVVGDIGRLEQVLVNLLNNARDAGGRTLELTTDTVHDGKIVWVRIAVEDSGSGIPAEILPQLFHAFVTTKPRGKGTGLGLRICRRILEEMGGRISAANRETGGARFEILLPARQV